MRGETGDVGPQGQTGPVGYTGPAGRPARKAPPALSVTPGRRVGPAFVAIPVSRAHQVRPGWSATPGRAVRPAHKAPPALSATPGRRVGPGPRGETGAVGPVGDTGPQGRTGPVGITGAQGAAGQVGLGAAVVGDVHVYWPFRAGSGTTVDDMSASGSRPGELSASGVTWVHHSALGKTLSFDGSGDVGCAEDLAFFDTDLAFEAFFICDSYSAQARNVIFSA